jgi:Ca2+-binding RTX toxin-like protein
MMGTLASTKLTNAKVAVFANPGFVDIGAHDGDEGTNVQTSLTSLGHTVSAFTSFDPSRLAVALVGKSVLVIPELENSDLSAALDPASIFILREFVASGGTLAISGDGGSNYATLLNRAFGTTLNDGGSSAPSARTGAVAGTTFATDPANITDNDATTGVLASSLPTGALNLYAHGTDSTVFAFGFGKGQVEYLGWDWFDAKPTFTQDGGWLQVLNSAISKTNGTPSGAAITGTKHADLIDATHTVSGQPLPTARDDFIDGRKGNDTISGGDGNDHLIGGKGKDALSGDNGLDFLAGGKGDDSLSGGTGRDSFIFDTKLSAAGVDKLLDFTHGQDGIVLFQSVFASLGLGVLDLGVFVVGAKAHTSAQHIIYNDQNGKLYYDTDGHGGDAQVQIASLKGHPAISADDIFVV